MDANKRIVLQQIEYKIHKTCDLCVFGKFKPNNDFGHCINNHYDHEKHTDSHRYLSIHRSGSCADFQWDTTKQILIGRFEEFVEE